MATIKAPLGCSTAEAFFLFMDAKSSNHAFDKVQSLIQPTKHVHVAPLIRCMENFTT